MCSVRQESAEHDELHPEDPAPCPTIRHTRYAQSGQHLHPFSWPKNPMRTLPSGGPSVLESAYIATA